MYQQVADIGYFGKHTASSDHRVSLLSSFAGKDSLIRAMWDNIERPLSLSLLVCECMCDVAGYEQLAR